ncbi:kinase-like domain-containing protein [Melampsora americana]|nr:kinase-like domain-containing protein [Melampsora americana]
MMKTYHSSSFNTFYTAPSRPPSILDCAPRYSQEKPSNHGKSIAEDFENFNLLGSGGFSAVYRAKSKKDQNHYAIKVIEKHICQRKMVMNEINLLEDLHHPSIIGYSHYYQTDLQYHLIFELASGGDFRSKTPFSEKQAKVYIKNLAEAIEYLHRNNIIHRDLKLENVLLTSDNQIKLADFGLATKTKSGWAKGNCGTRFARAPEVIEGGPYTSAIDWWGLGIILYEMVMDRQPFYSPTRDGLEYQIKYVEVKFSPAVSPEFCRLVNSLLKKDPRDRVNCIENFLEQDFFSDVVSNLSKRF